MKNETLQILLVFLLLTAAVVLYSMFVGTDPAADVILSSKSWAQIMLFVGLPLFCLRYYFGNPEKRLMMEKVIRGAVLSSLIAVILVIVLRNFS